jgi:hypothetical protein
MGDRSTQSENNVGRKPERIWQEIAEQLRQEKRNPEEMVKLWRELDRAESESKRLRLQSEPSGQIRDRRVA